MNSTSNCITYDIFNKSTIAIGDKSYEMIGRTPDSLEVVFPIKKSKIFDYDAMFDIVSYYINYYCKNKIFKPNIYISNCSDYSYDKKIIKDLGLNAGASKVGLINSSFASKVEFKEKYGFCGAIIIDIGAGSTKVFASNSNYLSDYEIIDIGSDDIDRSIQNIIKNKNYIISEIEAEHIKKSIGNALPIDVEIASRVLAKNIVTNQYESIEITSTDVYTAVSEVLDSLFGKIASLVSSLNIEYVYDLSKKGISFYGDGSKLSGLKDYAEKRLNYITNFYSNPEMINISGIKRIVLDKKYSEMIEYL